jgi:hypothetical protein
MSFKSSFMCINDSYGYNKKDFSLIEKDDNSYNKYNKYNQNILMAQHLTNDKSIIKDNIKRNNQNISQNNFPLAWTCYKNNQGGWTCPMRGDK